MHDDLRHLLRCVVVVLTETKGKSLDDMELNEKTKVESTYKWEAFTLDLLSEMRLTRELVRSYWTSDWRCATSFVICGDISTVVINLADVWLLKIVKGPIFYVNQIILFICWRSDNNDMRLYFKLFFTKYIRIMNNVTRVLRNRWVSFPKDIGLKLILYTMREPQEMPQWTNTWNQYLATITGLFSPNLFQISSEDIIWLSNICIFVRNAGHTGTGN